MSNIVRLLISQGKPITEKMINEETSLFPSERKSENLELMIKKGYFWDNDKQVYRR